ncbi:MAG: hypothetical protein ACRELB_05510 [Polyangiaceae bacterium]
MPKNDNNKTARVARIKAIQAGLTKYYASTNLVLVGTSYTPAGLQAFLQADIDAINGSKSAQANWLTAVKVESDTDTKTDPVLRAIAAQVKAQYGESQNAGAILADFDLSPRKLVTLNAEQLAAKAAQLRATRAARNTMGSREKAKVKGVVPSASTQGATASASSPAGSSGTTVNGSNNAPASPASPVPNGATATSHT